LPGALLGAALGFHLYFRRPGLNSDTFAPAIFAGLWAVGGLAIGALVTLAAAWLIDRALRRAFSWRPMTAAAVTLLGVVGLCTGLYAPLEARLPALLWPPAQPRSPSKQPTPERSPCAQAPPSDPAERKAWDLECR
jgi:hypothetical protein